MKIALKVQACHQSWSMVAIAPINFGKCVVAPIDFEKNLVAAMDLTLFTQFFIEKLLS